MGCGGGHCLVLVATGSTATTGTLELASLGADTGAGVRAGDTGGRAKVFDSSPGVAETADEDGVGASGPGEGELVKGHAGSAGSRDPGASRLGEPEGANGELGELDHPLVIQNSSNKDADLVLLVLHVLGDPRHRQGRLVDLGHIQTLQHNPVELGPSPAREVPVQVNKKPKVRVLGLWRCAPALLHAATSFKVNSLHIITVSSNNNVHVPRQRKRK